MENIIKKEILREKENSTVSRIWTNRGTFLLIEDKAIDHEARLGNEYFISSSIDLKCILKPVSLETSEDSSHILYEDIDGELLNNKEVVDSIGGKEKLILALKIAVILKDLHSVGIIHNHISLENIIYNPKTRKIRLTDLTGSRVFLDEHEASDNHKLLKSVNPLYISPEQTGQIHKPIDYRTDLYSAGVIFYRIFTGYFPFEDGDIISRHLNENPEKIHIKNDLPHDVSKIVLKLLKKDPDSRYQSANALIRDLIRCIRGLKLEDAGLSDIKFRPDYSIPVPTKASVKMIQQLRRIEERTLFFLHGEKGSGKSYDVRFLEKKLKLRGYEYLKIDNCEITRTIPYFALINSIVPYKDRVYDLFTKLPAEITGLVYENNKSSGEIKDRNGLIYLFIKIIERIFEGKKAVIIVEDCEYMDRASIEVIDAVLGYEKFQDMLIVFTSAKRSLNEALSIDQLKSFPFRTAETFNFSHSLTRSYLASVLFTDRVRVNELSLFLYDITLGDPAFLSLLIDYLFKKELIVYNRHRGNFLWNLNRIKSSNIPESIEILIFELIDQFSEEEKGVIYSASVFGKSFSSKVIKKTLRSGNSFELKDTGNIFIPFDQDFFDFRFRTGKIRSLLEKTISGEFLHITKKNFARVILKKISHEDLFKIFIAVNFLNNASRLIIKENEILSHAELNLFCGLNLTSVFRYDEALYHFKESGFKAEILKIIDPSLVKKIYRNIIKTSYLAFDFSGMEQYSELLKSLDSDYQFDPSNFQDSSGDNMDHNAKERKNVLRIGKLVLPEKKLDINDLSNEIVIKALKKFKGNKSKAAGYLGISRQALYRRLEKINKN